MFVCLINWCCPTSNRACHTIHSVCTFAFLAPPKKCKTHLAPKIVTKRSWPCMGRTFSIFFLCSHMSACRCPILETVALEKYDSEYGTSVAGLRSSDLGPTRKSRLGPYQLTCFQPDLIKESAGCFSFQ